MNAPLKKPRTLFEKVWDSHIVAEEKNAPTILYIDLHLIHEVTSPQAFTGLRQRGIKVRRPEKVMATMDHCTSTLGVPINEMADPIGRAQLQQIIKNCKEFDIKLFEAGTPKNGIVHVVAPEQGLTQPGMTIVCGDSHTSTHGAFGALAFGIGTSEVEHVLASQCLLQVKPKSLEVRIDGKLSRGVTAKDIILAIIAKIGTSGGVGHVFEYTGSTIQDLSMDGRMTVCNMTIEGGARGGMIAPDDTTFDYIYGREHAPKGADWDEALRRWKTLPTDEDAKFDTCVELSVNDLAPMITFGTNPGMGMEIDGVIPDPKNEKDAEKRETLEKALAYMGLKPGTQLLGHPVDVVFVGSCTNSRLDDLRMAASVMKGRKIAEGIKMLVVPGSHEIKKDAEAEGLDEIFMRAGAEWRNPGCSMCLGMNEDKLQAGQYSVSTSNRNFEGRQGKGGRTMLASPLTAAASAIMGKVADIRTMVWD